MRYTLLIGFLLTLPSVDASIQCALTASREVVKVMDNGRMAIVRSEIIVHGANGIYGIPRAILWNQSKVL